MVLELVFSHIFHIYNILIFWHRGVVVITNAQLHSTKPELRFCTGSNPAHGVSEIRDGEDLWQWSQLEIRLNALLVNHTTKTIHHYHLFPYICWWYSSLHNYLVPSDLWYNWANEVSYNFHTHHTAGNQYLFYWQSVLDQTAFQMSFSLHYCAPCQ